MRRALLLLLLFNAACKGAPEHTAAPAGDTPAHNLILITIDTLRADRVGAYGYAAARTPTIDALAARGVRFERAYSAAPITLTSHATMLTGRYPPGHGARHNGMRVNPGVLKLPEWLSQQKVVSGAFVSAFPLDHRFGLVLGFETYSDRMPRGADGRPANERPGRVTVDEAISWLNEHRHEPFFLWVHLFEPHAPYGNPGDGRPLAARYDDEVAEADRQAGRLIDALGDKSSSTSIVLTADHGEAFGEHGEVSHSLFLYDTTLRVPLVIAGPGTTAGAVIQTPVTLADLAPTMTRLAGAPKMDADGIDLTPFLGGQEPPARDLYAETFAPLLDFGWSPLRAIRSGGFKFIASPKPELFQVSSDRDETRNLAASDRPRAVEMADRVERISSASLPKAARDLETSARLNALGYTSSGRPPADASRPDPKDKRALAMRLAQVTSGELSGTALRDALDQILKEDPANPQAHVRLGYALAAERKCPAAETHFKAAIAGGLPGPDALLGLASCQASSRQFAAADATLAQAETAEPGNAVVVANRGILLSDGGRPAEAIPILQRALTLDPDFDEARFNLAVACLRAGRRADAAREATELLRRLPSDAPQRPEVERLLATAR